MCLWLFDMFNPYAVLRGCNIYIGDNIRGEFWFDPISLAFYVLYLVGKVVGSIELYSLMIYILKDEVYVEFFFMKKLSKIELRSFSNLLKSGTSVLTEFNLDLMKYSVYSWTEVYSAIALDLRRI